MSSLPESAPRLFLTLLAFAATAHAHVISMSNGEATVRGNRLDFVLSIPTYESAHTADPDRTLLEHFRFSSRGETGRLLEKACHEEPARGVYVCAAEYAFSQPIEQLEVECTLYQVTVPNHIHLLRAENAGKQDQAMFDYTFTRTNLKFRPPTAFEVLVQQSFEGMLRVVAGPVQLLFLAALVLAARGRRELLLLTAMFLAGEIALVLIAGRMFWQPPPRFIEAAMALSIAYLAVEILFLPEAGMRWLVAGVLGGFHGLSLHLLLAGGDFRTGYILTGAALGELVVIAILALALWALQRKRMSTHFVRAGAALLFVFGISWFIVRMNS